MQRLDEQVYVIVDRATGVVTGPYRSVEPGNGQERAETVGSVTMNEVWYHCPWCDLAVTELEDGLEHHCEAFPC